MASTIEINLRGQICPDPLMQVQEEARRAAAGDTLLIWVDYPLAVENIGNWAEGAGHAIEVKKGHGEWEVRVTLA
ncbi:MAG: sulfurtransferase TusA family protein [bacterium]|nr:sulfurtransferase TusA family protein [bacterium]